MFETLADFALLAVVLWLIVRVDRLTKRVDALTSEDTP